MLLHRRPASKKPFVLNCTVVHASLYSQECLFEELQTQERLNDRVYINISRCTGQVAQLRNRNGERCHHGTKRKLEFSMLTHIYLPTARS